ncbi:MAG TPA: radical SAM protein, partial [Elusimicrobiales bacterium]|nr:radical SAM protein [Elusimicrobiales bacterium]
IYVEDMDNMVLGEQTACPAKSIFCHITTGGLVLPCPYLPMAFGDIKKEPLLTIFSRIQGHPHLKEQGVYCPTRDPAFIKKHLCGVGPEKPCVPVAAQNLVCAEGGCNNGCRKCGRDKKKRTAAEIARAVARVDKNYSTLDIFGGEPFARKDIFKILGAVPAGFGLNLHTNARVFSDPETVKRLEKYNIHCFKVPVFSLEREKYEAFTRIKGSFAQALAGIRNLSRAGFPVSVFIPEAEAGANWKKLAALGAVSVSSYAAATEGALPDSALCFGRQLGKVSLLWLRADPEAEA